MLLLFPYIYYWLFKVQPVKPILLIYLAFTGFNSIPNPIARSIAANIIFAVAFAYYLYF